MKPTIEVNYLSKKYRYGESQPYYTLRDTITGIIKTPLQLFSRGKQQTVLGKDEFWALKDISFNLNQGDVLGIVGPNGSGKSTLLKVLSQITPPTKGEAVMRGRVGSLLEVGTGFQQELTGRENIYLNGAILGMQKREINKKFDEIVDFSGVEKFLDTPVKHYSSGMYMRLAFAVAAHLDSEILIVDEVLAVGDVEFQKKCLGKMDKIANSEGRTILFVSHNMAAVKKLCHRGILLRSGKVVLDSDINTVIGEYTKIPRTIKNHFSPIKIPEIGIVVKKITVNKNNGGKVIPGKPLQIDIQLEAEHKMTNLGILLMISNDDINGRVFASNTKTTKGMDVVIKKGKNHLICQIDKLNLCSGKYSLGFGIDTPSVKSYYFNTGVFYFDVMETTLENSLLPTLSGYSHFYMDHRWEIVGNGR
jgi:lipopolysaccharide transport system ATP-binding protein